MHPEWRPVPGFESAYLVSAEGQVKSVARGAGRVPERLLKQFADRGGYMKLVLCNTGQRTNVYVHRLVAEAFLPNPEGLAHVNHIDGTKDNNCRENLEWTSSTENNIHACRVLLKRVRPVVAESTTGPVSLCYPSIRQALEDGFHRGSIQRCIEGRRRRHGGYRWHDCTPMKA